ncbi:hypothetical protein SynTAK9802_01092 [Synechococcus sp. TAK9802]|nr:hypothetical protein SynTAK9802_01092 [Synechococcus sp. TAK9802]
MSCLARRVVGLLSWPFSADLITAISFSSFRLLVKENAS